MVKIYWCDAGINSRNIAESTGWFPPVAIPINPQRVVMAVKFGAPAPINPAIDDKPRVMLKAGLRPMKSAVMGHRELPRTKPTYFPTVRTIEVSNDHNDPAHEVEAHMLFAAQQTPVARRD